MYPYSGGIINLGGALWRVLVNNPIYGDISLSLNLCYSGVVFEAYIFLELDRTEDASNHYQSNLRVYSSE